MTTNSEKLTLLARKISETERQLNELKRQFEIAERLDKMESEFYTPIFNYNQFYDTLKFIKTLDLDFLDTGFRWAETPQGEDYWLNRREEVEVLTNDDLTQIKKWAVNWMIKTIDQNKPDWMKTEGYQHA